jgi:acyl-CoA dehydrogenase
MYAELLAGRSMVRAIADRSRAGEEFTADAAATKLFCAAMATRLADLCLQIHGGYGLTKASVAERISRDSRSWWMEEGTAEIQQLLISRSLLR